ncbi:MAG TPA: hypothetical protein VMG38_01865 [Trebonia sp.]|nr:hypothetical protein [Trebonia sp.]
MRGSRLGAVLIGAGAVLALGSGWSTASAAVSHPVASGTGGTAAVSHPVASATGGTAAAASTARAHGGALAGTAVEVPGTAALNQGGSAAANSVSCASAGNCSAAGNYTDASGNTQGFVVSETNGSWDTAEEVPGLGALNTGGFANVESVSCASAGNCSAIGDYVDTSFDGHGFVVSEINGTWGTAEQIPGLAALNTGGSSNTYSVSCASAGNCSAGGYYSDGSLRSQGFVVSEINGTWGTAEEVPGLATLNGGGYAQVDSLSCASAGNCTAGGDYTDASGNQQVFVVSETNGAWGKAEEVPGTPTLNPGAGGDDEQLQSVSCASAGNCSAGGGYTDKSGNRQSFVVSETNGTWGTAQEVPGTAALNKGGQTAYLNAVSCASAGNCSAGGDYSDKSGHLQSYVVSETNGTWGTAQEVPGTATLNNDGYGGTYAVSCASAGNCGAVGAYKDGSGHFQVFVASQTSGTWGTAQEVPGTAALNAGGYALALSASCAAAGDCTTSGYYTDGSGDTQAFVTS